ncbi:MAG: hypothetical protein A3J47_03360 [Candidatus Yanofskybacteria bacterium RIFCSPHIGHO2_02_FULL_43_22]|uniref:Short-chain dehydrogenase n=1 Tax=Candidatus Yanofskybacteria bacterium RIFCSPHIGHO2_02_FULL_43_22 TaxID=1802681 RepID=A0A1F8FPE1_9BACT|nr:MAG: hypothetical protein A3J47_03360 [Candidatus Yanofskybacteria bacterium RIFCSPHIGHO2_02_FULL_43_22]
MDLTGRTALVTGGVGLLGSQFVKTLVLAGAKVAIFDVRTAFPSTLSEIRKYESSSFELFQVDITNTEQVKGGFEGISSMGMETPTILINCAGLDTVIGQTSLEQCGPFEDYSEETWDSVIDSHLKGAFLVSREFFLRFKSNGQKSGSIINISSTYGLVSPDQSAYEYRRQRGENFYKPVAYTVAKAGMIGFTKWLAEYGGPLGIRVNALVPGGTNAGQRLDPEFVEEYEKRTMLGRMASPDDYNEAVLFLASDASRYMTGATLVIDGGWTAK